MSAWELEVTDTFGGEANYSWVQRHRVPDLPTRKMYRVVRALTGWPSVTLDYDTGDLRCFRPGRGTGIAQVAYATYTTA